MEYNIQADTFEEGPYNDEDGPIVEKDIEDCGLENLDEARGGGPANKGYKGCENQAKSGQDVHEDGQDENQLQLLVRALWKTGLEVFIHQLLYRRGIYPRYTFCSTRFAGVDCKIHNNPGVLIYIADALKDVIPLMFGDEGMVQKKNTEHCRLREILIQIYDQSTEIIYEQFSLIFFALDGSIEKGAISSVFQCSLSNRVSFSDSKTCVSDYIIGEVERDLRDLVCSTGKLERPKSLVWKDSVSFKIALRLNEKSNDERRTPLNVGLDDEKWSRTTPTTSDTTGNRVLLNLANFACQFQYKLNSIKEESI